MEAVATYAPWLTAMTAATDLCRRLAKEIAKRYVADVKNIAGDDQARQP